MPWEIMKEGDGYWVVKKGSHKKEHKKPHMSRAEAQRHMAALYAAEEGRVPPPPKRK